MNAVVIQAKSWVTRIAAARVANTRSRSLKSVMPQVTNR